MSKILKKVAAMLAITAVAAVSTFAASADESAVKLNIENNVTGNPGETVYVDVKISGAALEYDSLGLMVEYDKSLTLQNVGSEYGDMKFGVASRDDASYCLVYDFMGSAFSYESGDTLFTFEFTIPEDASMDQKYQVKWAENEGFSPVLSNTSLENEQINFELSDSYDAIICTGGEAAAESTENVSDVQKEEIPAEKMPAAEIPAAEKVEPPAGPAAVKQFDTVEKLVKVTRREQQIQKIQKDSNYARFLNQYYEQQQIIQNTVFKVG